MNRETWLEKRDSTRHRHPGVKLINSVRLINSFEFKTPISEEPETKFSILSRKNLLSRDFLWNKELHFLKKL